MESRALLSQLEFHDPVAFAQPLLVNQDIRILRWMLKPGQTIADHAVPDSPFYIVILEGRGVFTGSDGKEEEHGPATLLLFNTGETHSVRALDDALVFVSFMHGANFMRPDQTGGEIGREATRAPDRRDP